MDMVMVMDMVMDIFKLRKKNKIIILFYSIDI